MKSLLSIIITIGVILLAVIAVLAVSRPALAGGDHHPVAQPPPTSSVPVAKKKDNRWQVPILVIGAGVWCWFECRESEPPPAKPDPYPLSVAPKQTEQFYILEVR